MTGCEETRLLIAAYLLGGLEQDEIERLDAHLGTCPECMEEHDRLRPVVSLIGLAGPPVVAALPEGFEERLVAVAGRPPGLPHARPTRARRDRWHVLRRGQLGFALGGALAGAAATVALLFLFGTFDRSTPTRPATLTVKLAPTAQAPNASAVVYVIRGQGSSTVALEARGLPRAKADEHYEVWLSNKHGAYSVGTIEVTNGWASAVLRSPRTVVTGSLVEISLVRGGRGGKGGGYRALVEGTVAS